MASRCPVPKPEDLDPARCQFARLEFGFAIYQCIKKPGHEGIHALHAKDPEAIRVQAQQIREKQRQKK